MNFWNGHRVVVQCLLPLAPSQNRRSIRIALLAGSMLAALPTMASAQQLIQNSSFETVSNPGSTANTFCTAAFWTTVGNCNSDYQYNTAANIPPATGNISINLTIRNNVQLSQAVDVARTGLYTFAFQYILVGGSHSANASVGAQVFTLTTSQSAWTAFSQTVSLAKGATTVSFTSTLGGIANFSLDDVTLTLLRARSLADVLPTTMSVNMANVTGAIVNYANTGAALPAAFDGLSELSASQLRNAATQMSGEAGASSIQSSFVATTQFMNTMFDAAFDNVASSGAPTSAGQQALGYAAGPMSGASTSNAYAAITKAVPFVTAAQPRWTVWGSTYGGNSRVSGNATVGSNDTNSRIWGVVGGADYRISPDTRAGFALGGGATSFDVGSDLGGGKADTMQFGAYAKHQIGAAYVAGALSYAWQSTTTDRTVTIAGRDTLHSAFDTNALTARLESGWRIAAPTAAITPYAAVQSSTFFLPSYAETAAGGATTFALNYAARDVTATRGELGARWDAAVAAQDGTIFELKARTAWAHDWNRNSTAIATFQSLPGSSAFTVNGATPSSDALLLSLGAKLKFRNGWAVLASYEGEHASNSTSNVGRGTLKYEW